MIFFGKSANQRMSGLYQCDRVMATKEAELRKTIDTQTGEIDELRKSNRRLKEELVNRVSCFRRRDGNPADPRNPPRRAGHEVCPLQAIMVVLLRLATRAESSSSKSTTNKRSNISCRLMPRAWLDYNLSTSR
jgi:hypothetical protein